MAHHMPAGPVEEPQYSAVRTLTRSLHFPDFKTCYDSKKMSARPIKMSYHSTLHQVNQVLWFEPSLSSPDEHNWYGNVSFIIDLDDLLQRYGSNFYYIDKQEFETHTASRVVLSKRSPSLKSVEVYQEGSPIKREGLSWNHATTCKSSRFDMVVPHKLEVAIEVDADDCEWIFKRAKVEPNNHDQANTKIGFGSRTCHRENTFGRTCTYPLGREEARKKLEEDCPDDNKA